MRATDEEIESDPEAFDCEACEWRQWQAALSDSDRRALRVYEMLSRTVVRDLKITPLVFDLLNLSLTETEAFRLLEDLELIHTILAPPTPVEDDHDG